MPVTDPTQATGATAATAASASSQYASTVRPSQVPWVLGAYRQSSKGDEIDTASHVGAYPYEVAYGVFEGREMVLRECIISARARAQKTSSPGTNTNMRDEVYRECHGTVVNTNKFTNTTGDRARTLMIPASQMAEFKTIKDVSPEAGVILTSRISEGPRDAQTSTAQAGEAGEVVSGTESMQALASAGASSAGTRRHIMLYVNPDPDKRIMNDRLGVLRAAASQCEAQSQTGSVGSQSEVDWSKIGHKTVFEGTLTLPFLESVDPNVTPTPTDTETEYVTPEWLDDNWDGRVLRSTG